VSAQTAFVEPTTLTLIIFCPACGTIYGTMPSGVQKDAYTGQQIAIEYLDVTMCKWCLQPLPPIPGTIGEGGGE